MGSSPMYKGNKKMTANLYRLQQGKKKEEEIGNLLAVEANRKDIHYIQTIRLTIGRHKQSNGIIIRT